MSGSLARLVAVVAVLTTTSAGVVDQLLVETEDAIIVEASDLAEVVRSRRQLWPQYPGSAQGWPGAPAGVDGTCSTADGRSGTCLGRAACRWTRDAAEIDFNSLGGSLGFCTVTDTNSRRGEPTLRGVCCPPDEQTAAATKRPPQAVTHWWQRLEEAYAPTHSWQASSTTSKPAAGVPWWQATTTNRAPPAAAAGGATTAYPFITHSWQKTTKKPDQPWGKPSSTTTRAPATRPPSTASWQTSTEKSPSVTHWWQSTAGTPPSASVTNPPAAAGTTNTPYPFITHVWQATKPGGGATRPTTTQRPPHRPPPTAGPPVTQFWQSTTKRTTTAATQAPAPPAGGGGAFSACGTRSTEGVDRVVGGKEAAQGEFPWIAGIFKGSRQFCGGSLIDKKHILTAAHCVAHMTSYDVSQLTVRLGDHNIRSTHEAEHATYKVARIVRHKGFSEQTLHDDIALITLSEKVQYRSHIRPVCLDSGGGSYAGDIVIVAGWGSLQEAGPQPATLRKVSLKVWENDKCRRTYGSSAPGGIISSMLCAGRQGKDSCSGDSGGPLMKISGVVLQVGVVSWGIGCGKAQYPGVYTRVASLRSWIDRNRNQF